MSPRRPRAALQRASGASFPLLVVSLPPAWHAGFVRASSGFHFSPLVTGSLCSPVSLTLQLAAPMARGWGQKGRYTAPVSPALLPCMGEGRGKFHFPFIFPSLQQVPSRACTVPAPYLHRTIIQQCAEKATSPACGLSCLHPVQHSMLPLCELIKRGLPCIGLKLRSLLFTFGQKLPCHAPSIRVFIQPMLVPFWVMVA